MRTPTALRTERLVFAGVGAFLVPWTAIYVLTSDENAGGLLLGLCAIALLALAAYLTTSTRGVPPRPEDAGDGAARADAAHEPPAVSVWPLVIGSGATLLGFGMAFTSWVAVPAGLVIALGVLGYAKESSSA